MKKKTIHRRQGDVLCVKVTNLPSGTKKAKAGRCILAYGESTGHCHEIIDTNNVQVFDPPAGKNTDDRGIEIAMYLKVGKDGATVKHQEHAPITLDEGTWEIKRQREYSPIGNSTVSD